MVAPAKKSPTRLPKKLNVWHSIGQAYRCLWHYRFFHAVIAFLAVLPFCLAGLLGYFDPLFSVSPLARYSPVGFNLSFGLLLLVSLVWAVPMLILWHRLYLLGPEHFIRRKFWPLITRSLNVISQFLVFFGLGLLVAALTVWGVLYLRMISESEQLAGSITELSETEYALYSGGIVFIVVCFLILALRFHAAFSALSIGRRVRFTTSWQLTRKRTIRMGIALVLGLLPFVFLNGLLLALAWFFQIYSSGHEGFPPAFYFFILISAPLLTLPLAGLCALTASFYREIFSEDDDHDPA